MPDGFAEANPAGGSPAILKIDISQPALQEMIRTGSLEVKDSVHMFSGSAWGKLNQLATFSKIP